MQFISGPEVARLLPWDACIDAVERAFRAWPAPIGVLGLGGFHIKAGLLGRYFAAKVNGNFPGNPSRGLPTIQGVVVLCDAGNGTPLAVPDAESLTIIGCGAQALAQVEAVRAVRDIRRVRCVDVVPGRAAALAAACGGEVATGPAEADIVVTCTTSHSPVLAAADVRPGTFVAAVGADHPDKRELAADLMGTARVVVDVLEQARAFGELHHAPGGRAPAELGAIIAGREPGRTSPEEVIVFDSTGMALQDVAAAAVIYERSLLAQDFHGRPPEYLAAPAEPHDGGERHGGGQHGA